MDKASLEAKLVELNQQFTDTQAELYRLQGEYRATEKILNDLVTKEEPDANPE